MPSLPTGDDFLTAVLERVGPYVRLGRALTGRGTAFNVAAVATALLVQGVIQARASRTLLRTEEPESALPNIRCLYECFGELHYLLTAEDPHHEAVTAFAFAMKELEETARGWDSEGVEHLAADRQKLAAAVPAAAESSNAR